MNIIRGENPCVLSFSLFTSKVSEISVAGVRTTSSGWGSSQGSLELTQSFPFYGTAGAASQELGQQDDVTARLLSTILESPWRLGGLPGHWQLSHSVCTFQNGQWVSRGTKGCAPEHVHWDPISGCLEEKVTGFTQGRLCLSILFAFCEERTGLWTWGEQQWPITWKSARHSASSPTTFLCPRQ